MMSPWPFVRWGLAAVVYVLTVAISIDLLNDRDKEIASLRAKFGGVADELHGMSKDAEKLKLGMIEGQENMREVASNLTKMQNMTDLQAMFAERMQMQEDSANLIAKLEANGNDLANATSPQVARTAKSKEAELVEESRVFIEKMKILDARIAKQRVICNFPERPKTVK